MSESIDLFCHWLTPKFVKRMQAVSKRPMHMFNRAVAMPVMTTLEARFRVMDKFPGYQQVPSLISPPVEAIGDAAVSLELARIANDEQAEIVANHPDRFAGFVAAIPMNDPAAACFEATRAICELGALGVQVYTNVNGGPLDTPERLDVFRHVARLGRPIWLHPTRGMDFPDYKTETHSKFDMWWAFGWPYETAVAMGRLVFSGLMDEPQPPQIITHHAGGIVPMLEGRIESGLALLGSRCPPGMEHLVETPLKTRPIDSFRRFLTDTATFGGQEGLKCGLNFFGVDQMVFASDMPFDPEQGPGYIRSTLDAIERLPISKAEKQQILSGNAKRICGLNKAVAKK